MRTELRKVFDAITSEKHLNALLHSTSTQMCESINSLHVSMHPKRRDLSRGRLGRAIHKFTAARFNDGVRDAVLSVCEVLCNTAHRMLTDMSKIASLGY